MEQRAGRGDRCTESKTPGHSHSLLSSSVRSNLRTSRCLTSDSGSLTS
jgi:hypothetical protein